MSLDFISSGGSQSGRMLVFDGSGNLLDTVTTSSLSTGRTETMRASRATADIAFVVAYTFTGSFGRLDNLQFGTPKASTQTDADGKYAFTELADGEYIVRQVVPEDFRQTSPSEGPSRLFATTFFGTHRIQELDPATGAVLNEFPLPAQQASFTHGLAFDSETLFYLENSAKVLYELDADTGAVLDSTALAGQLANRNIGGLAAMNGLVYLLDTTSTTAAPGLLVFNPNTDQVTASFPRLIGETVDGGLAALPGENLLVAASRDNEFLLLDPATGAIRERVAYTSTTSNATVSGLAVLNGDIYLTGAAALPT